MADVYLVTGAAGFIASHVVKRLLAKGHEVWAVDSMLTGREDNINPGAKFIYLDLANIHQYYKLDRCKPKAILHLAGQSSAEISHESPVNDMNINALSTLLLGQWAQRQGCQRIIFASSVSVYGDGLECGRPMTESDPPMPRSFYGCSKLASEYYLKVFQNEGVNTTSLRLFNVYGPGQNMCNMKQGMVSIYLSFILKAKELIIKGSLDRFRDFVYVDDVVDAFVNYVDDVNTYGKIFNVGTGRKTHVRELVEFLLAKTGKPEFPVVVAGGTAGDTFGSVSDPSLFRNACGWQAATSLEEGITRMVQHYTPDLAMNGRVS